MSVLLIFVARERKYAEINIQIIVENAILNPVPRLAPNAAICVQNKLLTVIRHPSMVSNILIINTIAWVSDRRNGTRLRSFSFLVWESRKNGIVKIVNTIPYHI